LRPHEPNAVEPHRLRPHPPAAVAVVVVAVGVDVGVNGDAVRIWVQFFTPERITVVVGAQLLSTPLLTARGP
jgi:hypothetical protein